MANKKFKLSKRSLSELEGVHPDVQAVVYRAIEITETDFAVHDGIRTKPQQKKLVDGGASQTMNSKHLKQEDGFGHAVDLVPVINSKLRWEWEAIYNIAKAVRQAADELDVNIRWGGNWQILTGTTEEPETMVRDYVLKKLSQGRKAFTDGPHYELRKRIHDA